MLLLWFASLLLCRCCFCAPLRARSATSIESLEAAPYDFLRSAQRHAPLDVLGRAASARNGIKRRPVTRPESQMQTELHKVLRRRARSAARPARRSVRATRSLIEWCECCDVR